MARLVQPGVEKLLGQPLIIENRPGAGGLIAIDAVAKSPPDGYVIGLGGTAALGSNHGFQAKPAYDAAQGHRAGDRACRLAVHAGGGAVVPGQVGLRDVIALAKAQGDKLTIGHGGNGTLMHLTAELFNQMAGTKARPRPLPRHGAGGDRPDRQPCGVRPHRSALGHGGDRGRQDQGGRGHLGQAHSRACPTFQPSPSWACRASSSNGSFGIVVPAGTPADVIAKLNGAFVKVLNDPEIAARIRELGGEPMPMTPDAVCRLHQDGDREVAQGRGLGPAAKLTRALR